MIDGMESPVKFKIVPYDRARHEAFVCSSFTRGARKPWESLCSRLRRPETTCLVAHAERDVDSLFGWAAVQEGAILWVYVRDLWGTVRHRGIATQLLQSAGVYTDNNVTVPCLFWSPAASDIASGGKHRIYYAPKWGQRRDEE